MLSFLFDANTSSERDDTKKLFARLQELENDTNLTEVERDEDVADVLNELAQQYDLTTNSHLYDAIAELLQTLADDSDLYTPFYAASDAFVGDVTLDAENRARMVRKISLYTHADVNRDIVQNTLLSIAQTLLEALPEGAYEDSTTGAQTFDVRLAELLAQPSQVVGASLQPLLSSQMQNTALFHSLKETLTSNVSYVHENIRKHALPEDLVRDHDTGQIIHLFLRNSCLEAFFALGIPFTIPQDVRFEHMHMVAGSGHGKTQTLQYLIKRDIEQVREGNLGFAVIDSQGDLIQKIKEREAIGQMQDHVLIVDPNDIAFPPALNMFDMGLSHTENADSVEREKIINGTVDLYAYIFSSLLGAELTQKQGVIFTYLARMMMVIPGANIRTLQALVEDGKQFEEHFHKLDPLSQHFFEKQFFSKNFAPTRQQVLTRLWGVLSNKTFERMFSARQNKVNLFEAMNEGKIVLINTAKDLLKTEGCSIFGRFFIALIAQAALSRSILPEDQRKPFMVYIDEAHDYFDDRIEDIANQARKYNVGLVLSHQNLDQASTKLRASIMSSTSIKFAGGVSAKDAQVLAQNMQTKPETILSAKKNKRGTQFACYVRNLTAQPLMINIPFGVLEDMPKMSEADQQALFVANRERVAIAQDDTPLETESVEPIESKPLKEVTKVESIEKHQKGKGGQVHKEVQEKLSNAAIAHGMQAQIESHVGEGKHIDLVLHHGDKAIACEVSVSTSVTHELANVQKCIDGGFADIWIICDETAWIESFRKALNKAAYAKANVSIYTTEEALVCIGQIQIDSRVATIGGRSVECSVKEIPKQEQEHREIVLAKILINE